MKSQYSYAIHAGNNQSKRAAEVVENAQEFFTHRDNFLSVFDIDSFGSIENVSSMDIICRGYPPIYDPNFRQRGLNGDVVSNLKQLYECATTVKPTFDNALRRIAASNAMDSRDEIGLISGSGNEAGLVLSPLKALDQASDKVQRKYRLIDPGPAEAWLYDVVRASFVCHSEAQIGAICDSIQAFPSFEVVRIKNRFTSPPVNGYRDIQLIVRLIVKNQLGHLVSFICEVCVTHVSQANYKLSHPRVREVSDFFNPLLCGSVEKQEALSALLEEFVHAAQEEKRKQQQQSAEAEGEGVDLGALVIRLAAPHYEQGNTEASSNQYFEDDLDFVMENWVELLTFLQMYEEAERFQIVVLRIVMQIAGGEEDHPDVAEALDAHAMLLKLQVNEHTYTSCTHTYAFICIHVANLWGVVGLFTTLDCWGNSA
jgi:ppGpp synthetase/RelA/SpoT-type nucleotidyltranferase